MNDADKRSHCYKQWDLYQKKAKSLLLPSHRKMMLGKPQTRSERKASRAYLTALTAEQWWATAARAWSADEHGRPEKQCEFTGRYIPGAPRMSDYLREKPWMEKTRPEWASYLR